MKNVFIKLGFFSITFLFLFLVGINVKASTIDTMNINNNMVFVAADNEQCPAFGDPDNINDPAHWMQEALDIMKYAAIVALLVLVTADFLSAMTQNDKDAIKKASSKAIKRFIYCVLLFFLPIVVKLIMTLFGVYGTCGIG